MNKLTTRALIITASTMALFLSSVSGANPQLEDAMKKIGQTFKIIGRQLPDPKKNASTAGLANDLLPLLTQARDIMPDSIASMPEPQKTEAFAEYHQLLTDVLELDRQLIIALNNNDNKGANKIAQSMLDKRKDGHDKFKQD